VSVRCVTNISKRNLDAVLDARNYLKIHHYNDYQGIRFLTVDNRKSFTALDCDAMQSESELHNIWLWSNNADFAKSLRATFEILWTQSHSMENRMHEILTKAPTV